MYCYSANENGLLINPSAMAQNEMRACKLTEANVPQKNVTFGFCNLTRSIKSINIGIIFTE